MFYKLDDEDESEEEEREKEVNINTDTAFEHVRQLMLKEKILEAVTYMWKICLHLKRNSDIENLSPEAKEECLFLLLLKTFMESESNPIDGNENVDRQHSEDKNKEDDEILALKRVVNYLKVCFRYVILIVNYLLKYVLYYNIFFRIVWNLQMN